MRAQYFSSRWFEQLYKTMLRSVSRAFYHLYARIMVMDRYERIFVVSLLVIMFLLLFSPIMILSPNDESGQRLIFLLTHFALFKTSIVVLGVMIVILAWHLHPLFKNYIIDTIGFDKNPYLLSFLLLTVILASMMTIGDVARIFSDYSTMLQMHFMYYVIQIMLIVMDAFCLYMLLQWSAGFAGHVVSYSNRQSASSSSDVKQGLFADIKDGLQ